MSGYTPGLVWKKYSFIHTILHQKKIYFLSRLQWLCSYTGSHLCKPWKLHFFPLHGLNSPSAFDGRAIVDTFLFSIPERQKLPTLLIESEAYTANYKIRHQCFTYFIVFVFRNSHFNELNFCGTNII